MPQYASSIELQHMVTTLTVTCLRVFRSSTVKARSAQISV